MKAATPATQGEAADEYAAAQITASVLQRTVGEHWRAVFTSGAGPRVYGLAFVLAYDAQVAAKGRVSRENIAWVTANVHAGLSRSQVYALLRSRNLVAENVTAIGLYAPLPGSGCEAAADYAYRYFPEVHPDLPAACVHPGVFVEYTIGAGFVCGIEARQRFLFDERENLISVIDDAEQTSCL